MILQNSNELLLLICHRNLNNARLFGLLFSLTYNINAAVFSQDSLSGVYCNIVGYDSTSLTFYPDGIFEYSDDRCHGSSKGNGNYRINKNVLILDFKGEYKRGKMKSYNLKCLTDSSEADLHRIFLQFHVKDLKGTNIIGAQVAVINPDNSRDTICDSTNEVGITSLQCEQGQEALTVRISYNGAVYYYNEVVPNQCKMITITQEFPDDCVIPGGTQWIYSLTVSKKGNLKMRMQGNDFETGDKTFRRVVE